MLINAHKEVHMAILDIAAIGVALMLLYLVFRMLRPSGCFKL